MSVWQSSLDQSNFQGSPNSQNDRIALYQTLQAKNLSSDNGSVTIGGSIIHGPVNITGRTRESSILDRLWFDSITKRERSVDKEHNGTFRWLLHEPSADEIRGMTDAIKTRGVWHWGILDSDATSDSVDGTSDSVDGMSDSDDWTSDSDDEMRNYDDDRPIVVPWPKMPAGNFRVHSGPVFNLNTGKYEDCIRANDSDNYNDGITSQHDPAELTSDEQNEVNNATREELENRQQQRQAFEQWLRSGDGVFHISGKAGSGKSTLIKFLTREEKTHLLLGKWAKDRGQKLIIARFFFWASGDELQRSLEGLYRAVLWNVLSQRPDLIPRVFPDAESSRRSQMPFERDELHSALDRLFGHQENHEDFPRICLFIDGLDECDGDYWKLSRSLLEWSSPGNVKFCVSSRPFNEFMKLFGTNPERHFQLSDLTRFDMYQFVTSELLTDGRIQSGGLTQHEATNIASDIVDKADGVFLWIRLVTDSLLKSVGNDCTSAQLIERLRRLPRGLYSLFLRMIQALDDSERRRAARTLLILSSTGSGYQKRHLYAHWIMDKLADEPQLVKSITSGDLKPRWSYKRWLSTRHHSVAHRIVARCQGLVEIPQSKDMDLAGPLGLRLDFTHRSVSEFLKEDKVRLKLWKMAGPSFNPQRAMIQAILAWIKFQKWSSSDHIQHFPGIDSLVDDLIEITSKCYQTESLDDHHISEQEIECLVTMCTQLAGTIGDGRFRLQVARWEFPVPLQPNGKPESLPVNSRDTDAVITSWIFRSGSLEIGLERVKRNPSLLLPRPLGANVLLAAAQASERLHKKGHQHDILKDLINLERCSSKAEYSVYYHYGSGDDAECLHTSFGTCHVPYLSKIPWTPWTAYLFSLTMDRTTESDPRNSGVIHTFLDNGADASVCFVGNITDALEPGSDIDLRYVTLHDMMLFWGLNVTPEIARAMETPSEVSIWHYLKGLYPFVGQARGPQAGENISRLDLETLAFNEASQAEYGEGWNFVTLKVLPLKQVQEISVEEVQSVWEKLDRQHSNSYLIL